MNARNALNERKSVTFSLILLVIVILASKIFSQIKNKNAITYNYKRKRYYLVTFLKMSLFEKYVVS